MPLQLNKPISEISDQKPVLTILYQDEYLIAVDKPAGLFVHRSFMDKNEIYFALQLVRDQIGKYVYPVHRLDRPTSGVLLFALTQEVAQKMNEAFASKSNEVNIRENSTQEAYTNTELTKTYFALVRGHLAMFEHDTLIDHALKEKLDKIGDKNVRRDKPAQLAQTNYRVIKQAGDINYGDNKQNPFFTNHFGFKRLMLIAKSLSFLHPITHEKVIINAAFDQQWQYLFNTLDWSDDIS